jgi:hypothetical protein
MIFSRWNAFMHSISQGMKKTKNFSDPPLSEPDGQRSRGQPEPCLPEHRMMKADK